MTDSEASLMTVGDWRRKSGDLLNQPNDGLHSLIKKAFDSVYVIISPTSNCNAMQRALRTLDSERKISMEYEDSNAESIRFITFGLIESVQLGFVHLTAKIDSLQTIIDNNVPKSNVNQYIQTEEIPLGFDIDEIKVKIEELINDSPEQPVHIEDVQEISEFPRPAANSLEGLSIVPKVGKSFQLEPKKEPVEPKNEPFDTTEMRPQDNQISDIDNVGTDMDFMEEGMLNDDINDRMDDVIPRNADISSNEPPVSNDIEEESIRKVDSISEDLIEKEEEKKEPIDPSSDALKDSSESVEVEKRRKSSRIVSKSMNYTESLDDSDSEPAVKKSRSDSEKKKTNEIGSSCNQKVQSSKVDKRGRQVGKLNDSELECLECEYRSRSVHTWMEHLRLKHSTNPYLAGVALLCDCGQESLSEHHSRTCTIANVTVIHKRDGPIRRLSDEKTTPQCVLCEAYPGTTNGYFVHLRKHLKSTLKANGIYLVCECGLEVRSEHDFIHSKECDKRQFTLHKLNEN